MDQQILGKRIKYFRLRSNLSQFQLETEIDMSSGQLSRIERGEINPTKETLNKISEVLDLNERERDYLYGSLFESANQELINKAIVEVKEYFSQKGVLAYLLDDRGRLVYISDDFVRLLGYNEQLRLKFIGKSFIGIVLGNELNVKAWLSEDSYEDILQKLLTRFYDDSGFMVDDPAYQEALDFIMRDKLAAKLWSEIISNSNRKVHTLPAREVYFKFGSLKVKMTYSDEALPKYRRFEMVEYTPTSRVLKLLSKLI